MLLSTGSLASLPLHALDNGLSVSLPAYDRASLQPGVVHLGLGAFHRAHQALVFNQLLARGDRRWGIHGVAMASTHLADALQRQDGLYAVQLASADELRWSICGAMLTTSVAARERADVVAAIAAPATRWITLTVTEKGYNPEVAQLIVDGLEARRLAGLPGLTIASCDNLTENGEKLRQLCLAAVAQPPAAALRDWIETHCAFPNSMVDRIVPAATDEHRQAAGRALGVQDEAAMGTEAFWEWVIDDCFADPADARALADAGVQVVPSVKPFEDAKLRILNGSHSALALMGAVQGLETVSDGMADPLAQPFVRRFMDEIAMTGVERPGLAAYRDALLKRFANPHLHHRLHQIANDSSKKIPMRWLSSLEANLAAGRNIDLLALACAAWIRYLLGYDESGRHYAMSDPMAEQLQAMVQMQKTDALAAARALMSVESIWGSALLADARWTPRVTHWLERINSASMQAALRECLSQ